MTAEFKFPKLRGPNLPEMAARLGLEFGFEVAEGIAKVEDRRIRREVIRAARELVAKTARLYERSFWQALEAARETPAGGVVKVTIKLSDDKSVEEMRRIGDA